MVIVGAAAAARPDGAAVLAVAARIALAAGAGQGRRLERLQRAARGGLARGAASISASCRARAGSTWRACWRRPARVQLDVVYLLGADEIDMARARQGLRRLPGQPRRCRRAARRRHPAGRGLHREERHLRQHRGSRADDEPRRLRAGRRQGGLGDRARAVRAGRPQAALRQPFRAARRHVQGGAGAGAPRHGRARRHRRAWRRWPRAAGRWGPSRSGAAVRDFYLTNPIARASAVMAELSALKPRACQQGTTGTHG